MRDIGIDLGTTNILIYVKGKGIVLNEPSVVSIDTNTKKVLAVGTEAKEMLGRTPGKVKAIRPMKDGVIADFETTEEMLNLFMKKAIGRNLFSKPRILICCPSNITGVEKNAIKEIAERMGAKKVFLEEEPKVAAVGAGIDISKPSGSMVIDIGGGTTDIAVLSLGGIVTSDSIKIAGNTFDDDISKYIKDKYKVIIGEKTAENIKTSIGTVLKSNKKETLEITGRSTSTGLPETITVTGEDVMESLKDDIKKIVSAVKNVLEKTPPELAADISDKGIILTGGGSLINGLVEKLRKDLKVPVFISDNPLTNVAEGTGILLDNLYLIDN
ncbi:MAG: rod shape-determining protein [Tenericutes bacterium]|nr:rod shape-determining protein [Mycoplasmatota bacterium]